MHKQLLGITLIIIGIFVGLYVGLWVCFVGGIIDIYTQLAVVEVMNATALGLGIVKVVLANFAGWLSAILLVLPGITMLD